MDDCLIVFLKQPRPGAVKTRLIPALGGETAAALYRAVAEAGVRATAPAGGSYRRVLFFSPPAARDEVAAWFPGEELRPQRGEDLGARLAAAFAEVFREGARRVAVIGSDVPWVTRAGVEQALQALADHDVVLGPALDGGYYLLALARPCPGLFAGVPWSTPGVMAATLERARALGLSPRVLEPLPDIDSPEDLRREWERLAPLLSPALRARVGAGL